MDISDDTTLWLFPVPVGSFSDQNFSETEYLRTQVAVIEAHVEHFPSDERDFRALAWIEANASQYRHWWQTQAATSRYHVHSTMGYRDA